MIREAVYPVDKVFSVIGPAIDEGRQHMLFDGTNLNVASMRYRTFRKSCTCVICGLKGTFFAMEKHHASTPNCHLNLYGYDKNGKEVLFTKDHIIPKSKGGSDTIDNFQTMCERCNGEKGNMDDAEYKRMKGII